MNQRNGMTFLCPTGHLGTAPLKNRSFQIGVDRKPNVIAADSGSADIGPTPLALDISPSLPSWQKSDLEKMLLAARRLDVPMIIGSSGDTGTNSRVDMFVRFIQEIAEENSLDAFKVGYFYSEVPKEYLTDRLRNGESIRSLGGRNDLTFHDVEISSRFVAVAGVHPYIELLNRGADVIIGGRSSDPAIFASAALHNGYPEHNAYHLGKIMECASFCAEPYAGKESVLGTVGFDGVSVTAMHPDQRCTVASVSGHSMYERPNPNYEYVLGGRLDMSHCEYKQLDPRTCGITGAIFEQAETLSVKIEGAAVIGSRSIGLAGVRDPYTIANIDRVIRWARDEVASRYPKENYTLNYHVYGRDAVMAEWEPTPLPGHEIGIVVESVATNPTLAEEICVAGTKQMFYARLDDVKGTAGGVSYLFDEALPARDACIWTANHAMNIADPMELFPADITTAGI